MKIYILGDSFTDNLFKTELDAIKSGIKRENQVHEYVLELKKRNIEDPLHFEDYLNLWGHEVINLGIEGCSNYSIYHQFTQIKEPFDTLIVNWTGLVRFDWYGEGKQCRTFTGGTRPEGKISTIDELLIEQGYNRLENEIYRKKTLDLITFFSNTYKKQNPIVWSPFKDVSLFIENVNGFTWDINNPTFNSLIPEKNLLNIYDESQHKFNDRHYGRYGNFYNAVIFNTIIEHTKDIGHDGLYMQDSILVNKIKQNLINTPHNITPFNSII